MGAWGGARRGAGGAGAGRAEVGQREEGAGPVAPPLGPPAVRMVPVGPLLRLIGLLAGQGEGHVGGRVGSGMGCHPVVVTTVPVGGGAAGEGGWSRC